jgi:hypothetical protein
MDINLTIEASLRRICYQANEDWHICVDSVLSDQWWGTVGSNRRHVSFITMSTSWPRDSLEGCLEVDVKAKVCFKAAEGVMTEEALAPLSSFGRRVLLVATSLRHVSSPNLFISCFQLHQLYRL